MPNLYADLGAFQRRIQKGTAFSANDALEALRVLGAASRTIDGYCRRVFYVVTESRDFSPVGGRIYAEIPECTAVTSIMLDENNDGIYERTLVPGTDYNLINENNELVSLDAPPFTIIRLLRLGSMPAFPISFSQYSRFRIMRVTGTWGYSDNSETLLTSAGTAVTGDIASASSTTLTVTGTPAYPIAPGMTIKIEAEQVYVRLDSLVSPFVIDRGLNGTVAVAHAAKPLSRVTYEPEVTEAVLIQASRLWKRREVPLYPLLAVPGRPDVVLAQGLDIDIQEMLTRVKRLRDF